MAKFEIPSFWDQLTEYEAFQIKSEGTYKFYEKSEVVFKEGEVQNTIYIVESGIFKIYTESESGQEGILGLFRPGEVIAGIAIFFDRKIYPASCQCLHEGSLFMISSVKLERILRQNADMLYKYCKFIYNRVISFQLRLKSLLLSTAEERLVDFLYSIGAYENEVKLPIPKNQIALLLGITSETLSRTLKALEKKGLIEKTKTGHYRLLKEPKLSVLQLI